MAQDFEPGGPARVAPDIIEPADDFFEVLSPVYRPMSMFIVIHYLVLLLFYLVSGVVIPQNVKKMSQSLHPNLHLILNRNAD